jgi:hypothetical protein
MELIIKFLIYSINTINGMKNSSLKLKKKLIQKENLKHYSKNKTANEIDKNQKNEIEKIVK